MPDKEIYVCRTSYCDWVGDDPIGVRKDFCPKCCRHIESASYLSGQLSFFKKKLQQVERFRRKRAWANFKKPEITVTEKRFDGRLYSGLITLEMQQPHLRVNEFRCSLTVHVWRTSGYPGSPPTVCYNAELETPRHIIDLQHDNGHDYFYRFHIKHLLDSARSYERNLYKELKKRHRIQEDWTKR
jgi:hypothetical protein